MIERREFISLLGGAAAWPLAVRARRVVDGYPVPGNHGPEDWTGWLGW